MNRDKYRNISRSDTTTARHKYTCSECGCPVQVGEKYTTHRYTAKGFKKMIKTVSCSDCVQLASHMSHSKTFIYGHGELIDTVRLYLPLMMAQCYRLPGTRFRTLRHLINHRLSTRDVNIWRRPVRHWESGGTR